MRSVLACVVIFLTAVPATNAWKNVDANAAAADLSRNVARDVARINGIVQRAKSGALPRHVPTATTDDRRSADMCAEFNKDFAGVLYDFSNSNNGYLAAYPAGCGFMDLIHLYKKTAVSDEPAYAKGCATTGTASNSSCGSTGFYAKASKIVSKFNGMLKPNCNATGTMVFNGNSYPINMGSANEQLKSISTITAFICVSDAGKFCFPPYMRAATSGSLDAPTQASLASFCTPCTTKLMLSLYGAAGASPEAKEDFAAQLSVLDMLCLKVGKTFCYPPANKVYTLKTADAGKQQADFTCNDPCGPVVKAKDLEIRQMKGNNVDFEYASMTAQCYKNGQGYCGTYLNDVGQADNSYTKIIGTCSAPANGPDTVPFPANPATCSANCKTDFTEMLSTSGSGWGCCLPSLLQYVPQQVFKDWFNEQNKMCSSTMPAKCNAAAGAKPVTFKVCLDNLAHTYATATSTKAKAQESVIADVSSNVGVMPTMCKVATVTKQGTSGTCFEVTCTPATALQSGNVAALADTFVTKRRSGAQMVMGATAALPANAKVDPSAGMSAKVPNLPDCGGSCPANNLAAAGNAANDKTTAATPSVADPKGDPVTSGVTSITIGAASVGILVLNMVFAN